MGEYGTLMTPGRNSHVTGKIKTIYALPAFALAVAGIPVYVYLPKFYTDVVGVDVAMLGLIVLGVRIFDAITDPAMGFISDRTVSRFGRRRPYIIVGGCFLACTLYFLFNPPALPSEKSTLWFGFWMFMLFLSWTVVTVPYESLGPEISFDYHERTSLFAFRDGFLIAGTLAAASAPTIVRYVFSLPQNPSGDRKMFYIISVGYVPIIIVFCLLCVYIIREKQIVSVRPRVGLWRELGHIRQNRPFIILLISYTISAIGNNLPATLILYYVAYVLKSDAADFFLLLYFLTGILFLPMWISVSGRFDKKNTWIGAMILNTGAFFGVFFLGAGDTAAYGILVFLSGIGFGATLAIPSAIQADVIDYDELLSGERREGHYVGIWSVSKKMAAAIGVSVGLTIIGKAGYKPNIEQSEHVILTIKTMYALVPCLCNLIAILVAFTYPITKDKHQTIREAIDQRKKSLSADMS